MQNRSNLFVDSLSFLVADKGNTAEAIQNFLKIHHHETIDLNQPNSDGLRVVEVAALSGSISSLKYLIEDCKVDISSDEDTPNLVERSLRNPAAREYLLNPQTKHWHAFNDGTTDFLAHVMAGRIAEATAMLSANPHHICDKNIRYQNAIHWNHFINHKEMWIKLRAEAYLLHNNETKQWSNTARYYACMGHYKRLQYPDNHSIALMQYELSIQQFKKAIQSCTSSQDAFPFRIELATMLLFSGRMHTAMQSSAAHSISQSESCLTEGIKIMRSLPKDLHNKNAYLMDCLYREHAENCFLLDDLNFAIADRIHADSFDSIEFYKKAVHYGQAAIRSAAEISKTGKSDVAALQKYCDKLIMSYLSLKTCHAKLSRLNANPENAAFHLIETKRYHDLANKILDRTSTTNPSTLVPALPTSVVTPLTNSPNRYMNGFLRSPRSPTNGTNGINGHTPVLVTRSPTAQCGTKGVEDDMSELYLTPIYTPTLKI